MRGALHGFRRALRRGALGLSKLQLLSIVEAPSVCATWKLTNVSFSGDITETSKLRNLGQFIADCPELAIVCAGNRIKVRFGAENRLAPVN